MAPLLRPGSLIVAQPIDPQTKLQVGDVVVARRPDRPALDIIKRIESVTEAGSFLLAGDNPSASTDSRHFGAVTRDQIVARVRWRYWPLPPVRL
jgi:nickel-type superoxide dismutase maturation protease